MIPPVAPPPGMDASRQQPQQPQSSSFKQSSSGPSDPYASSSSSFAPAKLNRNPPSYRSTPGDPYGDAKAQGQRSELFGDYAPKEEIQKEREYGYEGREQEEDFDEDEEIEGIKQQMRGVKQESLASTR